MNRQKRVAAIHDISGFGKCSLTVALPIISSAGIETCVIPTAVLSTHTGGFSGYTYRDLSCDILPIAEHWKSLNISFDAIYTGYIGSVNQFEILIKIIDLLKTDSTLIIVDPVMADDGSLYTGFGNDFPKLMRDFVSHADIIIPNITEASLLLDTQYKEGPYSQEYISGILHGLSQLGPKKIVLTGVSLDDKNIGAAAYDSASDKIDYILSPRIEGSYYGTGDVFGSALVASLLRGHDLSDSSRIAVDFTISSIIRTHDAGTDVRYGINFEQGLAAFIAAL